MEFHCWINLYIAQFWLCNFLAQKCLKAPHYCLYDKTQTPQSDIQGPFCVWNIGLKITSTQNFENIAPLTFDFQYFYWEFQFNPSTPPLYVIYFFLSRGSEVFFKALVVCSFMIRIDMCTSFVFHSLYWEFDGFSDLDIYISLFWETFLHYFFDNFFSKFSKFSFTRFFWIDFLIFCSTSWESDLTLAFIF